MWYRLLSIGLLLASSTTDERFLPENLEASVVECGVGIQRNGQANAIVIVRWPSGGEYRAVLSIRPTRIDAAHDCQVWYNDLANAWRTQKGGK